MAINQPDDAARVLDKAAWCLLKVDDEKHIRDGMQLLTHGIKILEAEGRPMQAGMFGVKMLKQSLKMKNIDPNVLETGHMSLKMLANSGNPKLTGNCLILMLMNLVKHSENFTLRDGQSIFQEYVGSISDEAKELVKNLLHVLNDKNDYDQLVQLIQKDNLLKTDKELREALERFVTSKENTLEKEDLTTDVTKVEGQRRMKDLSTVLGLATGAALVASTVSTSRMMGGNRRALKEVWDPSKDVVGPYSDVTGFEHVQPSSVGR